MKKSKLSHKIAAAVTVGAMTSVAGQAFAGAPTAAQAAAGGTTDVTAMTSSITNATGTFTTFMSLLGYVGGTGLSIAGIFKLKQHVDNPGQTPMKDGLMRLAAGGALLSLPYITKVVQGGISNGNAGNGAQVNALDTFTAPAAAAG